MRRLLGENCRVEAAGQPGAMPAFWRLRQQIRAFCTWRSFCLEGRRGVRHRPADGCEELESCQSRRSVRPQAHIPICSRCCLSRRQCRAPPIRCRQLLAAFYPSGQNDPLTAPASAPGTNTPAAVPLRGRRRLRFQPGHDVDADLPAGTICGDPSVTSQAQSLFSQFDANGDGQISQSEFENAFGSNADTSKVDGLFNSLDANGDGSVSQDEMTSAAQQSHAATTTTITPMAEVAGRAAAAGALSDLLSSTDATGATAQTASNADGSTARPRSPTPMDRPST